MMAAVASAAREITPAGCAGRAHTGACGGAQTAARAVSSRPAACNVFLRPTRAGDGAIHDGARHGAVGMLLVPPGDVGVGRRVQAGAQHVPVVLIKAWRSARRTARREGRSRARRARPKSAPLSSRRTWRSLPCAPCQASV